MTSLNPSVRLALINKAKSKKNILQQGFTLVELMVVIVVVGVLSAVALPQFLGVKDRAEIGATIGENVGLAKECSAQLLIDGILPTDCTAGATGGFTWTSAPATANAVGLACGPLEADKLAVEETCTIAVNGETGAISYTVN